VNDEERMTFADFPVDFHSIPKDTDDHYIHVGPLTPDARSRVDRLLRAFLTLCDEEQDLVVQEMEIG